MEPVGVKDGEDLNLVDAFLGPGPRREAVENWEETALQVPARLRREIARAGPDEGLRLLLERAEKYPAHSPRAI